MNVYNLTDLTGQRANDKRTVTLLTAELTPKVLVVSVVALIPSLVLAVAFWGLLGSYAILIPVVVVVAADWLFTARTNDARRLPQYKALLDQRQAKAMVGKFVVGTRVVDPMMSDSLHLVSASIPVDMDPALLPTSDTQRAERVEQLFAATKHQSTAPP